THDTLSTEAQEALRSGQQRAAQALTTYGDHYSDQPLWREAIAFGEQARRLAPDRPEPHRFLAQVYSITGWYIRAWQSWNSYLEAGGELDAQARGQLVEVASWLGQNSFARGDHATAISYFETILGIEPGNRLANDRLVRSYLEL